MKTVIITGCSRGIGLAITKQLLAQKKFYIIGTSTSGSHSISSSHFQCYALDLMNETSINNFVKKIQKHKIDFLINNAGILLEKWNNATINMKELRQTFEVNLFGTVQLTEQLLPCIQSNAHIINITSDWGSFSEQNFDEFQPHYKMSKAALNMYTKLLAQRLIPYDIKVSALDPGWVKTDMGSMEASRIPEEIAKEVLFLMNNEIISGQFWHKNKIRNW